MIQFSTDEQHNTLQQSLLFKSRSAFAKALMLGLAACSLSACSVKWTGWSGLEHDPLAFLASDNEEEQNQGLAPPPESAKTTGDLGAPPPLDMNPGGTLGSLGLKLDSYFDPSLDDDERIARLEKVVMAMHKDLEVIAPAVQNLSNQGAAIANTNYGNDSFDATTSPINLGSHSDVEELSSEEASPSDTSSFIDSDLPPPAPSATGNQSPVNPGPRALDTPSNTSAIVSGIRVGEHPDKVRIVFDVTKKTTYKADLDNQENILTVELPNAQWKMPVNSESFGKTPVVQSYKVDSMNNGQGNIFILQLKSPTSIIAQGKYPALSGEGERIVIDLKK